MEKKLRSYCKYQEEASKNKKCAPSPPALLRRKAAAVRHSPPLLSNAFVCRGDATKPNSMCYYIEPVKRDFSTPVANGARPSLAAATHPFPAVLRARRGAAGLPAEAVCKKLKQKDDAICKLEWGEQLKTVRAPSTARAQGRQPRNRSAAGSAPGSCK